jgi:hypothetical protein
MIDLMRQGDQLRMASQVCDKATRRVRAGGLQQGPGGRRRPRHQPAAGHQQSSQTAASEMGTEKLTWSGQIG